MDSLANLVQAVEHDPRAIGGDRQPFLDLLNCFALNISEKKSWPITFSVNFVLGTFEMARSAGGRSKPTAPGRSSQFFTLCRKRIRAKLIRFDSAIRSAQAPR